MDGVWKRHRRWLRRPQSLKETLIRSIKRVRPEYDDFWALKDVSFSIDQGEAVGFCGANGAGKSTLLKVVSGILPPSYGTVRVHGRIASLLELGAGFLPELTGRENVCLNGAILGLADDEVASKMDSIVGFADLGDFIDSPVKTYSSGMYMRLGFAIASHVDADILLIDEVLAVGDAAFQQKCAEWLKVLRKRKTTVLVVSHDLGVLAKMCDRVICLDGGAVVDSGPSQQVIDAYKTHQLQRGAALASDGAAR